MESCKASLQCEHNVLLQEMNIAHVLLFCAVYIILYHKVQ